MQRNRTHAQHRAFTVIELLVVISILALLAAMTMSALANAAEQARAQRTRAIIDKIDQLIMEKWEGYRTRAIPYTRVNNNPRLSARNRLDALRELQRLEFPNNRYDIWDDPTYLSGNSVPAVTRGYRSRCLAAASWNGANDESECLYLIISSMKDGEKNAIDFFTASEIGDTDEDGQLEILDAWGTPIVFLRWPAGYVSDHPTAPAADTFQVKNATTSPDPFDPMKVDPRNDQVGGLIKHSPQTGTYPANTDLTDDTYALRPLIYSLGPNKASGVTLPDANFHYSNVDATNRPYPNDPYLPPVKDGEQIGEIFDEGASRDNITNHFRGEL